jgi:hypothetical protein
VLIGPPAGSVAGSFPFAAFEGEGLVCAAGNKTRSGVGIFLMRIKTLIARWCQSVVIRVRMAWLMMVMW